MKHKSWKLLFAVRDRHCIDGVDELSITRFTAEEWRSKPRCMGDYVALETPRGDIETAIPLFGPGYSRASSRDNLLEMWRELATFDPEFGGGTE